MGQVNIVKSVVFGLLWGGVVASGVFLGNWQIHRLAWKENLLATIDAAYTSPLYDLTETQFHTPDTPNFFIRGMIRGTFDGTTKLFVTPRVHNGIVGGHVYEYMRLEDGGFVWVNLGFSVKEPGPVTGDFYGPVSVYAPDFKGFAKTKDGLLPFTPAALGATGKAHLLAAHIDLSMDDLVPVSTRPHLSNNHLAYSVFWFGMSALAFLFGITLVIRKKPNG